MCQSLPRNGFHFDDETGERRHTGIRVTSNTERPISNREHPTRKEGMQPFTGPLPGSRVPGSIDVSARRAPPNFFAALPSGNL